MSSTRQINGSTLYLDQHMTEPDVHPFDGGTAAVFSSRCPDKDSPNEDAAATLAYSESAGALTVADGMGGGRAGEQAAAAALDALRKSLKTESAKDDGLPRTAILDGFEQANRAVQALGLGAATTLSVVEVDGRTVRPYHVGDTMVLVIGQRGKIKLQTICHGPVAMAVEAGLLDEADAMHHEDRHIVNNVVGLAEMRIEIGPAIKLADRDTLIIASDGLFDNLHVEEVVDCIRKGPLAEAAQNLARLAHQRMTSPTPNQPCKPDDLTFIAFRPAR